MRLKLGTLASTAHHCIKSTSAADEVNRRVDEAVKDRGETTEKDVRTLEQGKLHKLMDEAIEERRDRIHKAAERHDSNALWLLISAGAEYGFIEYLGLIGKARQAMRGRAKVEIRKKVKYATPPRESPNNSVARDLHRQADRLITQARRLGHMAARAKKLASEDISAELRTILRQHNTETHQGVISHGGNGTDDEEHHEIERIRGLDPCAHQSFAIFKGSEAWVSA